MFYTVTEQRELDILTFSCLELFDKPRQLVFFKLVANFQLEELFISPKIIYQNAYSDKSIAHSLCRKTMTSLRAVRM